MAKKPAPDFVAQSGVNLSKLLKNVDAFAALSNSQIQMLVERVEIASVAKGSALITSGEQSDCFYLVLRGRFIVQINGKAIAEIVAGEPIGELAFFAGITRTADVIAARNCDVIVLSRAVYQELSRELPGLSDSILASLAKRLAAITSKSTELRPTPGRIVTLIERNFGDFTGQESQIGDPQAFIGKLNEALKSELGTTLKWCLIGPDAVPASVADDALEMSAWIDRIERDHELVILCAFGSLVHKSFRSGAISHADSIFLMADPLPQSANRTNLTKEEHKLYQSDLANVQLVLRRKRHAAPITNSAFWLAGRPDHLHHHLALDSLADIKRLARLISGRAVGAVLCGGGAFGTAHLGAIKALQEHGTKIDMFGGTSVGAAMAAALASEKDPDEVMDLCEDIFLKSKAMGRLMVPMHSIIDHKRFDEQMKKHYGPYQVEDLPLNFFAIATSMTTNDIHVIRKGELWLAVRASSSIPAVFPPVIMPDGEVLIDGALIDNVPIATMRRLKPGVNLILNFKKSGAWRVNSKYESYPGRMGAMASLLGKKPKHPLPSIFEVLTKTMVITARRLIEATPIGDDILLEIPTLPKMGFLEWKRGREQFHSAYHAMAEDLERLSRANGAVDIRSLKAISIDSQYPSGS